MSNVLKCPECGSKVSPEQERCDHCGVWFKNSTSPTLSTVMADNDLGNKPIETISYYGHAYVPGSSGVGVSVSGNVVLSLSSPGGVRRVVNRISGRVVEETPEYVIIMTRKDQLVKIRPEDIIKRKPFSAVEEKKRVDIALEGGVGVFILMLGALIYIFGSVWLWVVFVVTGGLLSLHSWSRIATE